MKTRTKHAILGGLLAAAGLAPGPSHAQLSLSVSPVRVEHAVPPGEVLTDIVTVDNVSEEPLRARVTVADWYLERDGTPIFVKRGTRPNLSMSEWVDVNPTEFALEPGASQVIRYTLNIPEGLRDASYRTAVLVETLPDFTTAPARNVAYLTARIGVILYNRVGTTPPRAEVVAQEVVREPGRPNAAAVKLVIRNRGVVNFRLAGESQILGPGGHVLHTISIPDGVVLPQSDREVVLRLVEPMSHRVFTVLSRIDVGQDELLEVETRVGVVVADSDDAQQ